MQLSPLNFRGLIATMCIVGEPVEAADGLARRKPRAIECWRCSECDEVFDWESEAEDCCAEAISNENDASCAMACPVCAAESSSYRAASDCCLWKDLDTTSRWRIADAVAAGSTWVEQLGLKPKPLSGN